LLSGLIVSVVFIGLVFWEIKEIEKAQALDDELRVLSQSIINAETEAQPVNTFESKLVLAKNLLGSHTNWSNYINFLEENLLKDVYLTSAIGADTKGKYSLSLKGKDFSDIEKQIKVFKNNELVKDVWVRSGKVAEANKNQLLINRGVDFNLDFELVDNFFKQ